MSIEPTESPSEPEVHSGEEPRPTGDITVNVEKEELLDEAEEQYKDSDSVVIRGDAAGASGDSYGADYGECSSEPTKVKLPEELAKSVVILTCESTGRGGSCDVYLIGTAHVSKKAEFKKAIKPLVVSEELTEMEIKLEFNKNLDNCLALDESCRQVEAVIRILKPEVVFVELCSSRLSLLQPQILKVPTMSDIIESWKQEQNTFGLLYEWLLAKIASQLEVSPGAEFRVAYEEALKYGGKVILGDRPVQITLKRTWAKMPPRHKVKLLCYFLLQAVFLPSPKKLNRMLKDIDNDVDMVTSVIQEMGNKFPSLMDTLVHERDQYMASFLLRVASGNSSVVAVIGKGHIDGIKKNWKQPITMIDLMEIPREESVFTVKRIISSVVIGIAIVSGLFLARR